MKNQPLHSSCPAPLVGGSDSEPPRSDPSLLRNFSVALISFEVSLHSNKSRRRSEKSAGR